MNGAHRRSLHIFLPGPPDKFTQPSTKHRARRDIGVAELKLSTKQVWLSYLLFEKTIRWYPQGAKGKGAGLVVGMPDRLDWGDLNITAVLKAQRLSPRPTDLPTPGQSVASVLRGRGAVMLDYTC